MEQVPNQNSDFEARKDEFLAKYKLLIDEYKIDWISFPVYRPTDNGAWELTIQTQPADTSNQSIKSPFVAKA